MPPFVNLYPNNGKRSKMVEIAGVAGWKSLPKRREIGKRVEIPIMSKEKKIQKCKEEYKENLMHLIKFFAYKEGVLKKEKQLKAIWGYLSPRIEYLKDIPKNIFDKGISAISYTEEFKEEFDKNPKDALKHIIDKLNSELNSILHEYDFN